MINAHYTDLLLDQTSWIRKLARSLVIAPNVANDLVQLRHRGALARTASTC